MGWSTSRRRESCADVKAGVVRLRRHQQVLHSRPCAAPSPAFPTAAQSRPARRPNDVTRMHLQTPA
eukprot:6176132-Pleurochrysis_carterae.AAC.1